MALTPRTFPTIPVNAVSRMKKPTRMIIELSGMTPVITIVEEDILTVDGERIAKPPRQYREILDGKSTFVSPEREVTHDEVIALCDLIYYTLSNKPTPQPNQGEIPV